jgi:hypothetical protein
MPKDSNGVEFNPAIHETNKHTGQQTLTKAGAYRMKRGRKAATTTIAANTSTASTSPAPKAPPCTCAQCVGDNTPGD